MPKKSDLPKVRVHLMIYQEDFEFLKEMYDRETGTAAPIGVSEAASRIIHTKVLELRRLSAERYEQQQQRGAQANV